jgi:dimethylargininase
LLINASWVDTRPIEDFPLVRVPESEPWSANVLPFGNTVVLSSGAPRTAERIESLGFAVLPVDISEFAKAEGGVTCLSLLIPHRQP